MKKSIKITVLFFTIMTLVISQSFAEVKVIAKKGNVSYKNSSKKDWIGLKFNDMLKEEDQIKIGKKSFVLLYFENQKTIELSKPGNFSLMELKKSITKSSVLSNQCAVFLMSRLSCSRTPTDNKLEGRAKSSPGLIERSVVLDCVPRMKESKFKSSDLHHLVLNYPKTSYIIEPETEFSWTSVPEIKEYIFRLIDSDGEIVISKKTNDNKIVIKLSELKVKPGNCYFWEVSTGEEVSDSYCISFMSVDDLKKLNDSAQLVLNENPDLSPAAKEFIVAGFYAEKNIVSEAMKHFRQSIKLEPMADGFKAIYANYLSQQGYLDEASKLED